MQPGKGLRMKLSIDKEDECFGQLAVCCKGHKARESQKRKKSTVGEWLPCCQGENQVKFGRGRRALSVTG